MVDIIVEVLEKHSISMSEEVIQAIATDIENALDDDRHSLWSEDAFNFLSEVVNILKQDKKAMLDDTTERRELSALIYKIEECLIERK